MALDPRYITSVELQSYFVDKDTGLPLAGGEVWFWSDNNRNQLKPVYELTGSPPNYQYAPLPNPLPLSGVGTFMDNSGNDIAVYYYPFDSFGNVENYFIQVYAAGSPPPGGVPQFTREAWPNEIAENNTPGTTQSGYQNELSNSQFVNVLFDPTQVLTIPYSGGPGILSVQIAPGWILNISYVGAGNVLVQRAALAGSQQIPTNPPYSLIITAGANLSALSLTQELNGNPGIWSQTLTGNGYVATTVTLGPNSGTIAVSYLPSSGTEQLLLTGSNNTGQWKTLNSTTQLVPSDNAQVGGVGNVNIIIDLPAQNNSITQITSVQIAGVDSNIINIGYDQEPINRQIDHLFHYYNPQLRYKEIPSYLVGWDFPLNPAQFLGSTVAPFAIGANKSQYVWDQTIVFQTLNSDVGVSRAPSGAIRLTSQAGGTFAVIQYLEQTIARKILNDSFSINLAGVASNINGMNCHISCYYTKTTLPDLNSPNYNSIIATLNGNGTVNTVNGTWFKVSRDTLGDPNFTIGTNSTTNFNDYNFSGWNLLGNADADLATYFAIVISFSPTAAADYVDIGSVGLMAGNIATRPAPLSINETLAQCQHYYETSYDTYNGAIGAATTKNSIVAPQSSSTNNGGGANQYFFVRNAFSVQFNTLKVANVPLMHLYSVSGTIDNVQVNMYGGATGGASTVQDLATTNYAAPVVGNKGAYYNISNAGVSINLSYNGGFALPTSFILYHYTADARLGLV